MARKDDQKLLTELKSNWDYAVSYWREVRAQAETDVLYAEIGPWTDEEVAARAGRPTLSLDELNQYLNQLENQARINKRAVKVSPKGNGANDLTARTRGGMIRGIEYQSKAQTAYVGAFGDAVRRSYGYFKLTTDYEPGSNNRIIKILRIPNPDVIYLDPDFKEADASDCQWSFEAERMLETKFAKRWPKAEVRSFSMDHVTEAPAWITGSSNDLKHIQVASYCRVETSKKKLVQLEDGSTLDLADVEGAKLVKNGAKTIDGEDVDMVQMPDGALLRAVEWRDDDDPIVWQYITNGIEILERTELDFNEIPIIPVFGPERWITRAGTSKRTFRSLTRGARDAYKLYCYARSAQCERVGMDPKTPYEGWEGQFNTKSFQQGTNNPSNTPTGYVEFSPIMDPATGATVYNQLPQKNFSEPAIQQHEILAESARRAIQAAMGGTPLPTNAQRLNDKSGVALQKIEQSSDEGNFHYLDNYGRSLERAGRMMDAALDIVYDTPNRQVPFNNEAGEHSTITINPHDEQGNKLEGFHVGQGDHGVTISTGPSDASQREAAEDFVDTMIKTPQLLGPTPNKVVALAVKLRNIGYIGDQMAEIIDPPNAGPQIPPAVQEHMAKSDQTIQALTAEVQKLTAGVEIKKYDIDTRLKIAEMQERTKRTLGLLKVNVEEAGTVLDQELGVINAAVDRLHQHVLAQADRDHEAAQAEADRQHESTQSDADRQHQADMATQAQAQDASQQLAQTPPPPQPDLAAQQPVGGTQ
jgi:hypothetical protein